MYSSYICKSSHSPIRSIDQIHLEFVMILATTFFFPPFNVIWLYFTVIRCLRARLIRNVGYNSNIN
jgi:hypothetical protein